MAVTLDSDRGARALIYGSDGSVLRVIKTDTSGQLLVGPATTIAAADAMANPTVQEVLGLNLGYNGATWDRLRSSTANGLQVDVTRLQGKARETAHADSSGVWTAHHLPSSNTQATISKASAGGGTRNVCTELTVMLVAGASAPAAVNVSVSVIDGASGATTYLWRATISLPAVAGAASGVALSGLWLPGSQATALTLEFTAAGGANTLESVSMSGITLVE